MPAKKKTKTSEEHKFQQVDVRLCLKEGDSYYSSSPINSPDAAIDIMTDILKDLDREWMCVVNLDNKMKPINFNIVSIGSLNASLVPIQNVFKSGILCNAAGLLAIHVHPSGDVKPSREDFLVTKRIVEAGKLLELPLFDHIIVGARSCDRYSFKEDSPELFEGKYDMTYIRNMINSKVREKDAEYPEKSIYKKLEQGKHNITSHGKNTENRKETDRSEER